MQYLESDKFSILKKEIVNIIDNYKQLDINIPVEEIKEDYIEDNPEIYSHERNEDWT